MLHEELVGAAGQVERQAASFAGSPASDRAPWTSKSSAGDRPLPQAVDPVVDANVQPAEVFVLVPERLLRLAAALADALGELDHLVDRLLAVEPHDVLEGQLPAIGLGLARQRGKHLGEHRHHDLGPALADQRQRAVEVEQHMADAGPRRERGAKDDLTGELGLHRTGTPSVRAGWLIVAVFHCRQQGGFTGSGYSLGPPGRCSGARGNHTLPAHSGTLQSCG